ncbi:DUF4406 domain-containing protein [Serratia marcescens]|uniref:DUF4406 domain-containing protein n=1 Tax=Serratia marcescens TaxID=615 RepID=UPI00217A0F18|nr:DUF4406 domain-containing protein [Serratia marcescens]CAI1970441.1 Uncharacterised protein [Serratia marcescens]
MTNPKVYIAGPMTGLPDFNRPAFFAMAECIKAAGGIPLNPAILPDGLSQAEYMDICIAMIRCATRVVFLKGWESSLGARAEMALAVKLNLHIATGMEP